MNRVNGRVVEIRMENVPRSAHIPIRRQPFLLAEPSGPDIGIGDFVSLQVPVRDTHLYWLPVGMSLQVTDIADDRQTCTLCDGPLCKVVAVPLQDVRK